MSNNFVLHLIGSSEHNINIVKNALSIVEHEHALKMNYIKDLESFRSKGFQLDKEAILLVDPDLTGSERILQSLTSVVGVSEIGIGVACHVFDEKQMARLQMFGVDIFVPYKNQETASQAVRELMNISNSWLFLSDLASEEETSASDICNLFYKAGLSSLAVETVTPSSDGSDNNSKRNIKPPPLPINKKGANKSDNNTVVETGKSLLPNAPNSDSHQLGPLLPSPLSGEPAKVSKLNNQPPPIPANRKTEITSAIGTLVESNNSHSPGEPEKLLEYPNPERQGGSDNDSKRNTKPPPLPINKKGANKSDNNTVVEAGKSLLPNSDSNQIGPLLPSPDSGESAIPTKLGNHPPPIPVYRKTKIAFAKGTSTESINSHSPGEPEKLLENPNPERQIGLLQKNLLTDEMLKQLERLSKLYKDGIIDKDEFVEAKKRIFAA